MAFKMSKIYFVATVESAVNAFLLSHLEVLSKKFDLTVIVNTSDPSFLLKQGLKVEVVPLSISRSINFFSDLSCLFRLICLFLKNRPHAVHSITPKAGLLAMLASFLVRTPLRVHTFTGQVWVNKRGISRFILIFFDYVIAKLANFYIVDSLSQRNFLLQKKIITKKKSKVFGCGSVSGVNLERFKPCGKAFLDVRKALSIPPYAFVFIYLGRLNVDKGVLDLAEAFSKVENKQAYLIFVGPDEGDFTEKIKSLNKDKLPRIKFVGFTDKPESYLAASNVLCLPSYREGFGNVIIEAAAIAIPSIASNIYGISDALIDNETGVLHEPGNVASILGCLEDFINNPELVIRYGLNARARAIENFDSKLISKHWLDFYCSRTL